MCSRAPGGCGRLAHWTRRVLKLAWELGSRGSPAAPLPPSRTLRGLQGERSGPCLSESWDPLAPADSAPGWTQSVGKGLALCKVGTVPCEFLSVGTGVLGLSGSATRACQSINYMERGQIHVCQGPAIQWRLQIHFGAGPEESVGKGLAHCKVGVTPCSVFYNSSGCRKSGKKSSPSL